MESHIDSFLISVEVPVRVIASSERHVPGWEHVAFDGMKYEFQYPEGLAFPDVLYDETTGMIVGLVFAVCGDVNKIAQLVANADNVLVRMRDKSSALARELYLGNEHEVWLEVTWLTAAKLAYAPGQLANIAFWLTPGDRRLAAIELWDIHHHMSGFEFLTGCDLIVPDLSSHYPHLRLDDDSAVRST